MTKSTTEKPALGGSYRRRPDGSLVPLERPGMTKADSEAAAKAKEDLARDQAASTGDEATGRRKGRKE